MKNEAYLSRRERQIMDIVYAKGEASVRAVWQEIPRAPSYSTIRKLMAILEEKGYLEHRREKRAYYYTAVKKRQTAARGAIQRLVNTYYEGSAQKAMVGLLGMQWQIEDTEELKKLRELVDKIGK